MLKILLLAFSLFTFHQNDDFNGFFIMPTKPKLGFPQAAFYFTKTAYVFSFWENPHEVQELPFAWVWEDGKLTYQKAKMKELEKPTIRGVQQ